MPQPGQKIGDYVLESAMGAGVIAEVWRARDERDGKDVAVEILKPDLHALRLAGAGNTVAGQFTAEARRLARLRHPGLAMVHEVVEAPGTVAYGRDLLDGVDLGRKQDDLELLALLEIFGQIAETLAYMHDCGFAHRDVKPSNIFVTGGPGPSKLLGFGGPIHTVLASGAAASVDTVAMMAPESFGTEESSFATSLAISDQWSLGATMFRALTGFRPFDDRAFVGVVAKIKKAPVPRFVLHERFGIATIPPALEAFVARCLDRNPCARFDTMRALHAELGRCRDEISQDVAFAKDDTVPLDQETIAATVPAAAVSDVYRTTVDPGSPSSDVTRPTVDPDPAPSDVTRRAVDPSDEPARATTVGSPDVGDDDDSDDDPLEYAPTERARVPLSAVLPDGDSEASAAVAARLPRTAAEWREALAETKVADTGSEMDALDEEVVEEPSAPPATSGQGGALASAVLAPQAPDAAAPVEAAPPVAPPPPTPATPRSNRSRGYLIAIVCLAVGLALGWLLRGT